MTTCIHCGQTFDGGLEIIGDPEARISALLLKLGSHMQTQHGKQSQLLEVSGAPFTALLFLRGFKSDDPALNLRKEKMRWAVHQQTLNARFTNTSLENQCEDLAVKITRLFMDPANDTMKSIAFAEKAAEITGMLYEAMASVRDALEEPNRYATEKAVLVS